MAERISLGDTLASTRQLFETEPNAIALKELGAALAEVLKNERNELAKDLLQKDLVPFGRKLKDKAISIKDGGRAIAAFASNFQTSVKDKGFSFTLGHVTKDAADAAINLKNSAVELAFTALPEVRNRMIKFVDKIAADYDALETDQDKAKYIGKLALYASVFSYGFYQGHALPDSDFKIWGAGSHRSFISHSVLPMFVTAASATVLYRILERAEAKLEPGTDAQRWSQTIRTATKLFTAGFGAGLAFHLVVDGTIQTGGTIRIHDLNGNVLGSMIPGTRTDDMAYATAMGLFAGEMAKDSAKMAAKE
jgi:hypothetical protein